MCTSWTENADNAPIVSEDRGNRRKRKIIISQVETENERQINRKNGRESRLMETGIGRRERGKEEEGEGKEGNEGEGNAGRRTRGKGKRKKGKGKREKQGEGKEKGRTRGK